MGREAAAELGIHQAGEDLHKPQPAGSGPPAGQRWGAIGAGSSGEGGHRHLSAEQLRAEAGAAGLEVSLATIYNTLNQFTRSGLLREVVVEPGRSYFDTNTGEHHHFYFEAEGRLQDIPAEQVSLAALPPAPEGMRVSRVDVVVRVTK